MSTYIKNNLSFSNHGLPIKLGTASTPIHIGTASTTDWDEVWLYANSNDGNIILTIEHDNSSDKTILILPHQGGSELILPGYIYKNRKLLSAYLTSAGIELKNSTLYSSANLVSYYQFDGNAFDSKGTNHGTATGIVYGSEYGKFNQGAKCTSAYINFGNVFSFERTDSFSVSFWVKNFSTSTDKGIISKGSYATTGWGILNVDGEDLRVFLANSSSNRIIIDITPSNYYFSEYTHFAITYDGSSTAAGLKIYKDGIEQTTRDVIANSLSASIITASSTYINYFNSTTSDYWIDDLAIFNRVITAAEVLSLNTGNVFISGYVNSIVEDSYVRGGARYGYFAGGYTGANVVTTDRIVYSTGVTSVNTVSNLSQARRSHMGVSDKVLYGYFVGGYTDDAVVTSDRIIFSSGSTSANTVSNLGTKLSSAASVSDGITYGYFGGGFTVWNTNVATTNRIVFSSGVVSTNTISNISQARFDLSGISDGNVYGYFVGGDTAGTAGQVNTTDRIVFSSGNTNANTTSNLVVAKANPGSISDSTLYGYLAGGYTGAGIPISSAERIIFATGVFSSNTISNLSVARNSLSCTGDGSLYGYFAGGSTGGYINTADRIVFSTGVTSINTVSNLSQAKYLAWGLSDFAV